MKIKVDIPSQVVYNGIKNPNFVGLCSILIN